MRLHCDRTHRRLQQSLAGVASSAVLACIQHRPSKDLEFHFESFPCSISNPPHAICVWHALDYNRNRQEQDGLSFGTPQTSCSRNKRDKDAHACSGKACRFKQRRVLHLQNCQQNKICINGDTVAGSRNCLQSVLQLFASGDVGFIILCLVATRTS